jgi:hypothetical protein
MKVLYTAAALQDLDEIAEWLANHYPAIGPTVELRTREVVGRVVPVGRYITKSSIGLRTKRSKFFTSIMRHGGRGMKHR